MNRIEQLLAELAPDGVPHLPLGSVGTFIRGNGLQKADLTDSGFPAIHYGEIHTHYGVWTRRTKSFTSPELATRLRHAEPGNLIIATTSEDDEAVGKATAWLGDGEVAVSGDAFIFKHHLDPRFAAYFFQSQGFHTQKTRYISGAKVRRISRQALERLLIPVPPIEVQREIVGILDKFTELEADLEAELEARKKQYSHLSDSLITASSVSTVQKLGTIATVRRGASPRPIGNFLTDNDAGVPWIKIGDVPSEGKYITETSQKITKEGALQSRSIKPGDFLLSNSMSFGRPYISQIEGCIHDGWLAISSFEDSFIPEYLYYLLRSAPIQAEFERKAGSGTVRNLNADIVRSITVSVPPLAEQRATASLLNQFDALVNDINVGLPAELNARRKQYEYYRDKLLTFREAQ